MIKSEPQCVTEDVNVLCIETFFEQSDTAPSGYKYIASMRFRFLVVW